MSCASVMVIRKSHDMLAKQKHVYITMYAYFKSGSRTFFPHATLNTQKQATDS